jgi:hypothetical protein
MDSAMTSERFRYHMQYLRGFDNLKFFSRSIHIYTWRRAPEPRHQRAQQLHC